MSDRALRVSLHDKASLLTALVLLVMVSGANLLLWKQTGERFEDELRHGQEKVRLRLARMLDLQRDNTLLALRSLAGIAVPADAAGDRVSADLQLADALIASGLDLEFEQVLLVDNERAIAARFSAGREAAQPTEALREERLLRDLGREVLLRRSPLSRIACGQRCALIAAEPVLDGRGGSMAIVGQRSLADWVVSFAALDDAELMIWLRDEGAPELLANSGSDVLPAAVRPLLSRPPGSLPWLIDDPSSGQKYAVSSARIDSDPASANIQLMLAQDVGARYAQMREQRVGATWLSLLALLAGAWSVRQLLARVARRLRRLSTAMPMIADGQFEQARALIAKERPNRWTDEVDLLGDTATALIARLTELGTQVEERDHALTVQIDALRRQGEFVDRLFEHAQLSILVHDGVGRVIRSNAGGRAALAGTPSGSALLQLFVDDDEDDAARIQLFARIKSEPEAAPMVTENRLGSGSNQRSMRWIHCAVKGPDNEALLLSIGLDLTREQRALAEITWMADHDGLTGLFNRRRIEREIDELIARGDTFALLFIDLDGFGLINKSDGHEAGNEVLALVAKTLEDNVTRNDSVARTGGDEFMIILHDVQPAAVGSIAERLVQSLARHVTTSTGRSHDLSCCIGVAMFPSQCRTKAELFNHSDAALKEAKRAGQGEWVLRADAAHLVARSQHLSLWKERLQDALANDRFELVFQPIADLANGAISHFECLIRMRLPDGSIASPAEFISIAEEIGFIHRIDYWVIARSMRALREMSEYRPDLGLSVNLSGPTLQRADFLDTLRGIIAQSGLTRPRLILEVTETAALRDMRAAKSAMTELCQLGCEFALDDFGVGYSSFAYLRDLPFSYVKLDGSYVRQVLKDQRNQAFVRAIVVLANGYQLKTVAEFIESQELQDFLRGAGVHYGQGYHIANPGPLPDFEAPL